MATPFHPHNVCFYLAMVYTRAMHVFHSSLLTPTHFSCLECHARALLVFHWSRFTHTHFLYLGYHAHAFLFFWWSFCWFYLRPDGSINFIHQLHRRSREYITHPGFELGSSRPSSLTINVKLRPSDSMINEERVILLHWNPTKRLKI